MIVGLVIAATACCALLYCLALMWVRSFRDPRWRRPDFVSRQATAGDIYNVADLPVLRAARLVGPRRLRLQLAPRIRTQRWRVLTADGALHHAGPNPEIHFADQDDGSDFRGREFVCIPEGIELPREIRLWLHYFPKRHYEAAGLSWPDFYGLIDATIPVAYRNPWSAADWAGVADDNPVVYWLFANAAGVKTRLVDAKGFAGDVGLTGHYVCESRIPEEAAWTHVDPHTNAIANMRDSAGRLMNTVDLKHLVDRNALAGCAAEIFDAASGELVPKQGHRANWSPGRGAGGRATGQPKPLPDFGALAFNYFRGDMVLAFKFGYPHNPGYSRLRTFLWRPTLLYAPFALPRVHVWKLASIAGLTAATALSVAFGLILLLSP